MTLEADYVSDIASRVQGQMTIEASFRGQKKLPFPWNEGRLYRRPGGQRDRFPSTSFFIERWYEASDSSADYHDRHMMMIDGIFLSGDKSHKVTKLVFARLSADDAKLTAMFDGVFTLFNSRRQVRPPLTAILLL